MTLTTRRCLVTATLASLLGGGQLIPATAHAEPEPEPQPVSELHNVIYKARVDGVARGARISYKLGDEQVNTADPRMLPGRTFEATAVLSDPDLAGITITVDWPYSANLHCEILVDEQTIARADQFIAPRLTRQHDDPLYGTLQCGAPLSGRSGQGNILNTDPVGVPAPVDPVAPPEG